MVDFGRLVRGDQHYYATRLLGVVFGFYLWVSGLFVLVRVRYANEGYIRDAVPPVLGTEEAIRRYYREQIERMFNIDPSAGLGTQYVEFVWAVFTGDWGEASTFYEPNVQVLSGAVPWAVLLVAGSVIATITLWRFGPWSPSQRSEHHPHTLWGVYAGSFALLGVGIVVLSALVRGPAANTGSRPVGLYLYHAVTDSLYHSSTGWLVGDAGLLLGSLLLLGVTFFGGLFLTLAANHWLRAHDHQSSLGTALPKR